MLLHRSWHQVLRSTSDCVLQVFRLTYPYQEDLRNWGNVTQEAQESLFSMPAHLFYQQHPFHLIFDAEMRLVQAGPAIKRAIPDMEVGQHLQEHFQVRCTSKSYCRDVYLM